MDSRTGARPGDWVLVHRVVLEPGRRAPAVPQETQAVPLEMWVKGFLVEPGAEKPLPPGGPKPGDPVVVRTLTGRLASGVLVSLNPPIPHTFGSPVAELLAVGPELRQYLAQANDDGIGSRPGRGDANG